MALALETVACPEVWHHHAHASWHFSEGRRFRASESWTLLCFWFSLIIRICLCVFDSYIQIQI